MAPDQDERAAPQQSSGWRTASQLARRFVGSKPSIARRMIEVRRALIADTAATGLSPGSAEALVEEHLIRMQQEKSGLEQPVASQEAIAMLGLTERAQVEPSPPENWIPAADLGRQLGLRDHEVAVMVGRLYRQSIAALQLAGYPEDEAATTVQESLVRRSRATEGRRRVWHLSPNAVEQISAAVATATASAEKPDQGDWPQRWTFLLRSLVADMTAKGYSRAEAVEGIQKHLTTELCRAPEESGKGRR